MSLTWIGYFLIGLGAAGITVLGLTLFFDWKDKDNNVR